MYKYGFIKKNRKGEWLVLSEKESRDEMSIQKTREAAEAYLVKSKRPFELIHLNSELTAIKYSEEIKGGIGDNFDIAQIPKEELNKGLTVEREHSPHKDIQLDIVKDHEQEALELTGEPNYYEYLEEAENKMKEDGNAE